MKTSVTLTYFNRSGLAFAYDHFETEQTTMEPLIFDIAAMRDDGRLIHLSGREEDSYILVDCEAPWAYPHLILAPIVKEAIRAHWVSSSANLSNWAR